MKSLPSALALALAGCATATPMAPAVAVLAAPVASQAPLASEAVTRVASAAASAPPAVPETTTRALDPLGVDGITEAATIPDIVHTPAKELRRKSRADLHAALSLAKQAPSVDAAVDALVRRLGKPTWTEAGQRRVWIAPEAGRCHRLVVDSSGGVELESAPADEWKMLSAAARQRVCSGEIQRGL